MEGSCLAVYRWAVLGWAGCISEMLCFVRGLVHSCSWERLGLSMLGLNGCSLHKSPHLRQCHSLYNQDENISKMQD